MKRLTSKEIEGLLDIIHDGCNQLLKENPIQTKE